MIERELTSLIGSESVLPGTTRAYLSDATESRSIRGRADAIALPSSPEEVVSVVRWCYEHDVAIVPRGGGTGYAGGAVPLDGGVVLSLERLRHFSALDPELWRMHVQAGLTTADVHRLARENGLLFAPDPGAAEQSLIGGNIATNAGGPHAFKYGVTGAWVSGLEVVLAPGELATVGGPIRKDVAGYDIKSLMIGSEGTLGIVTAAWLKLLPAPEAALPIAALYPDAEAGCAAVGAVLGSGVIPAAVEFLDEGTVRAILKPTHPTRPAHPPDPTHRLFEDAGFIVIAEADGSAVEAAHVRGELIEAMSDRAISVHAPTEPREIDALWRWRSGVSFAVVAKRGGKVSEDIVVPGDRLLEAIEATLEIGRRHQLPACSWGHAGDGNLHSTFMIDLERPVELERAEQAAQDLFALATELGGSISGEHGIGTVKRGALAQQWAPPALAAHEAIKKLFDPKGLFNPGKKIAR
jgi:glycolate dehydrogenase FAD-linked subunit